MYARRIQLVNYGPVDDIDISFPFDEGHPKPIVLVGKNGTGKSIVLSHLVNGLTAAQGTAFQENPDVQSNKVYKLRSNSYIRAQRDHYFAKVDYHGGISIVEMRTRDIKQPGATIPHTITNDDAQAAWQQMRTGESDHFAGPRKNRDDETKIRDALRMHCILYFPPNRFEEPAWLNEENLNVKAEYMNLRHTSGYTNRPIIRYSALRDNQNWLFEVIYDRTVFELQTHQVRLPVETNGIPQTFPLPVFGGYAGQSENVYQNALEIVRIVLDQGPGIRFGIGRRSNRSVSVMQNEETVVPNIFQLSSGETSLLNIFLSILRDFDLSDAHFNSLDDIRGIVIVDEVDLHLHAIHQHDVLPRLIKLFPNVQFIVTTHAPLFVLGMEREFGTDGFGLYRMPEGDLIDPEEFSEFGQAYEVFAETSKFSDDVRSAIKDSQTPIVYVDGETDVKYLQRAAERLGRSSLLDNIDLRPAGGDGNLKSIWKRAHGLPADLVPQKVILLHDCDSDVTDSTVGNLMKCKVLHQSENPIQTGVENLFGWSTLKKAKAEKSAFIDVTPETIIERRGEQIVVPLCWEVNESEKMNLCDWLCENGDSEDFANFAIVIDILEELLATTPE